MKKYLGVKKEKLLHNIVDNGSFVGIVSEMKHYYSKKEFAMIQACSPHWASLIEKEVSITSIPPSVLDCVVMECFLENKQGSAVESLRRCMNALKHSKMHRMTPEYDALIKLDDTHIQTMKSTFGWHGQ